MLQDEGELTVDKLMSIVSWFFEEESLHDYLVGSDTGREIVNVSYLWSPGPSCLGFRVRDYGSGL